VTGNLPAVKLMITFGLAMKAVYQHWRCCRPTA